MNMFRTPLCISIALILSASFFVWEKQVRVKKKDQKPYDTIIAETTALRSKSALEHAPLYQFRKQVRKEMWLPQKKTEDSAIEPLEYILLEIASSDLLLFEKNSKLNAIEHWENIQGTPLVFAKRGQLDFRTASLFLDGSVCFAAPFSGKQSFALADFATIYWDEPRILLEGSPSQRVLFWQDGMEISAPTIQVRNSIEALGNVRLTLDSAETLRKSQFPKTTRVMP